jgi:CRISPR-associated protein Cas5t
MLSIYLRSPFAVCRSFTAGWYRPSATFLTPSAAYGLLLNVAGIESRLREEDPAHDGKTPASLIRPGLPAVRIALGLPVDDTGPEAFPRVETIYQQLHNYPVGTSGAEQAEQAKGCKYNITPVRREILVDLRAVISIAGNEELEDRVRRGLRGEFNRGRYGLPFVGDNQFLPDRLEVCACSRRARWYERIADGAKPRPRTARLTVWIDRAEMSKTVSYLFAPSDEVAAEPPNDAWVVIPPENGTQIRPPD